MKLKLNLNKKLLMTAGIYIGAFVVINVGVYFFLSTTQPKLGARVGMAGTGADSLSVDSLRVAALGDAQSAEPARVDSAAMPPDSLPALAQIPDSLPAATAPEPETASADPGITETDAEAPAGSDEEFAEPPMVTDANSAAEMTKLAKAIEAMKPDAAAAIAAQLTTDQIVALVMRMKDRTAGRMLAALPPDQAAQVALRMSTATMQAERK